MTEVIRVNKRIKRELQEIQEKFHKNTGGWMSFDDALSRYIEVGKKR